MARTTLKPIECNRQDPRQLWLHTQENQAEPEPVSWLLVIGRLLHFNIHVQIHLSMLFVV